MAKSFEDLVNDALEQTKQQQILAQPSIMDSVPGTPEEDKAISNAKIATEGVNLGMTTALGAKPVAPVGNPSMSLADALKNRAQNPTGQYGAIKAAQPLNPITKSMYQVDPTTGLNRIVTSSKGKPQFAEGGAPT